jgi:hypothetical protein
MLYTIGRSDASFQPKLAEFQFEWHGGRYELDQIQHGPILSGDATSDALHDLAYDRQSESGARARADELARRWSDISANADARNPSRLRMRALTILSGRAHGGR